MLAILDYQAGNQTSVYQALTALNIPAIITADPAELNKAQGIIFPGVGAAKQAMGYLTMHKLDALLIDLINNKKPLLGICLGCQILLQKSAEENTNTLGIFSGHCARFNPADTDETGENIRIPHMGWNTVTFDSNHPLFKNIPVDATFYFVHSYYPVPDPQYTIATGHYGASFAAVYGTDGLWAVQFHPEKSGRWGLQLLQNFYAWCQEKDKN